MELIWGPSEDFKLEGVRINVDDLSIAEVVESYICKDEEALGDCLNFTAEDITIPIARPYIKHRSGDRMEGGMYRASRVFTGLLDESLVGQYAVYSCSTVANKEPIQTHPEFNEFAGDAGSPKNGAVFDTTSGEWQRFSTYFEGKKNRKSGITDYYMPFVIFRESKLVLEEDLPKYVERLCRVDDSPPDTPFKPFYSKRNWLLTKAQPTWAGFRVYRLDREWTLSGPRGWDRQFYPPTKLSSST